MRELSKKEKWFLNYLRENSNYANGSSIEFISPTQIGRAYGNSLGVFMHSSSASPTLLKLTKLGFVIRNERGHYKIK